jgi:hypothetical protein
LLTYLIMDQPGSSRKFSYSSGKCSAGLQRPSTRTNPIMYGVFLQNRRDIRITTHWFTDIELPISR